MMMMMMLMMMMMTMMTMMMMMMRMMMMMMRMMMMFGFDLDDLGAMNHCLGLSYACVLIHLRNCFGFCTKN